MMRAGVPEKVAVSISGHRPEASLIGYDIVDEEDLREAALGHAEHVQNQARIAKVAAA